MICCSRKILIASSGKGLGGRELPAWVKHQLGCTWAIMRGKRGEWKEDLQRAASWRDKIKNSCRGKLGDGRGLKRTWKEERDWSKQRAAGAQGRGDAGKPSQGCKVVGGGRARGWHPKERRLHAANLKVF